MLQTWTVDVVIVAPDAVGQVVSHGAAALVEDAAWESGDLEGRWITRVAEEKRAGVEVHEVDVEDGALEAVRGRWTVLLRQLIADTPELAGWATDVAVRAEEDGDDEDGEDEPAEAGPAFAEHAEDARQRLLGSLIGAADEFRAVPLEDLLPADFDTLNPDDRATELLKATYLAGCVMQAAVIGTDHLFDDVEALGGTGADDEAVDAEDLFVIGQLPPRFADRYGALFAKRFLVAFADMTRRLTAGWEPLANVAQELALRVLLDLAEMVAETAEVELPDGWRTGIEDLLFEDADHEYLYDPAADGFEEDDDFGPPGMAPMRFEDWFVPFNEDRHLPVYATDRSATRPVPDNPED